MLQADRLYLELRKDIIEGTLEPGSRLLESKLARAHGISRTPVREALARLRAGGFVDRVPSHGYFVSELTIKGLKDTIEVRRIVEAAAAYLAAERATPAQRRALPELARFAPETADPYEAQETNAAFHRLIAEASQNALLVELVNYCLNQMARYLALGLNLPERYWSSIHEEHHLLADAIVEGRAEEAGAMIQKHLEDASRWLLDALIDARGEPSGVRSHAFGKASGH